MPAIKFIRREGGRDKKKLSGSLIYHVSGLSASISEQSVLDTNGLLEVGDVIPEGYIIAVSAKQTDEATRWEFKADYEIEGNADDDRQNPDLAMRPPEITWSAVRIKKKAIRAVQYRDSGAVLNSGTAVDIVNAVGDQYDPPVEEDVVHAVATVKFYRYDLSFDYADYTYYIDKIANHTLWGFAAYSARVMDVQAHVLFENDSWYQEINVVIEFDNTDFWYDHIPNCGGRYYKDTTSTPYTYVYDPDGGSHQVIALTAGSTVPKLFSASDDNEVQHGGIVNLTAYGTKLPPNTWPNYRHYRKYTATNINNLFN